MEGDLMVIFLSSDWMNSVVYESSATVGFRHDSDKVLDGILVLSVFSLLNLHSYGDGDQLEYDNHMLAWVLISGINLSHSAMKLLDIINIQMVIISKL